MKKNKFVDPLPVIKISKVKDNADGTCDVTFEYENDLVELFKKENKNKKATKKNIGDWLGILLEEYVTTEEKKSKNKNNAKI